MVALTALATLASPHVVRALDWGRGGAIPPGTTVDDDVVMIDRNIVVDGTVNGDLVALGSEEVIINGAAPRSVRLSSVLLARQTLRLDADLVAFSGRRPSENVCQLAH